MKKGCIKGIGSKFLNLSAITPTLFGISLLLVFLLMFPIALILKQILPWHPISVFEVILSLFLILYGLYLQNKITHKWVKRCYWLFWVVSVLIYCFGYRQIVLIQPIVAIFSSIWFEPRLQKVKEAFQRSNQTLAFLNIFDGGVIGLFYFLKYHFKYVEKNAEEIYDFINHYLPADTVFEVFIVVILVIVIPFIRTYFSIKIYKKQNHIDIPGNRTLFWINTIMGLFSIMLAAQSTVVVSELKTLPAILMFYSLMTFGSTLFWLGIRTSVDYKGNDKIQVISGGFLLFLLFIATILLMWLKSDLLNILIWFLPIVIPVFIGDIETQSRGIRYQKTEKMRDHLYWLQMVCFNTLLLINLWFSVEKHFKQINLQKYMSDLLAMLLNDLPNWFRDLYSLVIILILFVFLSLLLSNLCIRILKNYYLNLDKGYFIKESRQYQYKNRRRRH